MPSRIIRESARTSPTLDALSAEAERLFWRLITVADDHGRFDADPRVVLALAFPLKVGRLKPATVQRWLVELARADAILVYNVDGRAYGSFPAWAKHQRRPQSRSKFPAPPGEGHETTTMPPSNPHGAATVPPPSPHGASTMNTLLPREVVSREVVKSRIESRESGDGIPTAEELLLPPTPQQRRENLRRLREMAARIGRPLP
jgi:hypothetical protein